jgi:hypothetical protein
MRDGVGIDEGDAIFDQETRDGRLACGDASGEAHDLHV